VAVIKITQDWQNVPKELSSRRNKEALKKIKGMKCAMMSFKL
jgi:uncharacterized membrane protein (DUF106 family)